jgi:arylsulfatase A-like enzyme
MPSRNLIRALAVPAVLTLASASPVLGAVQAGSASADAAAAPQPNLVFIMADDLGWSDLSTGRTNFGNGNDFNETPQLDELAGQGQSFTDAYASVQCAPTRTALQTGQNAVRATNNVFAVAPVTGQQTDPLLGVTQGRVAEDGKTAIPQGYVTIGETLQKAGYATAYSGKFHVAASAAEIVTSHGFDENWGGSQASNASAYFAAGGQFNDSVSPSLDQFAGDYTQEYVDENIAPYSHGVGEAQLDALVGTAKHVTDAQTDAALDFIDRKKDEPFFTFVSEFAPHFPVNDSEARSDLLAKYKAKTPGVDPAKPSYAALVEGVDQSVARIVDYLETTPDPRNGGKPLADNTLVIFTSDNGGEEDQDIAGAYNGPLREDKGFKYEGGVRVPWIVWSQNPDLVRGGGLANDTIINSTDLYPTLAAYAKAPLPAGVQFDGTNLKPAFSQGTHTDRVNFLHLPGYVRFSGTLESSPFTSVREGRWKYYYNYTDGSIELYDLTAAIGETTDVAAQQPAVVHQIGEKLIDWLDETNAPLATLRTGQASRVLENFTGETYANGEVTQHDGDTITIAAGDQVPFILPKAAEPTVEEPTTPGTPPPADDPFIPGAPTPTVNGAAVAGRTVRAVPGTWPSGTTLSYQWYADGAPLADARSATLAVPRAAVGKTLRVAVTGTKAGNRATTTTSPATLRTAVTGKVRITGRARVGRTLRAVVSGWTPGAKISYRWRIGTKVTVTARPSLKLRQTHLGKRVRLAVVVTKAGHTTVTGTSTRTAKVVRR